MKYSGKALRAAGCAALFLCAAAASAASAVAPVTATQRLHEWVQSVDDHRGRPFAIVDKKAARIAVYQGGGELVAETVALIGATPGDHIVPGVGERAQHNAVRADERTTPAGRFDTLPGVNRGGEHVVWVDYESAFAIHRLRPGRAKASREARLATPGGWDKRVSLGCVIVPVAFYKDVVQRVIGRGRAVVYVLPETRSVEDFIALLKRRSES